MLRILHEAGMKLLEYAVYVFFSIAMLPLIVAVLIDDLVEQFRK